MPVPPRPRCGTAIRRPATALMKLNFTEKGRNDTIFEEPAEVAQLVEQLIRNQQVAGSSPAFGSIQSQYNQ
jgi:hypothetical protein